MPNALELTGIRKSFDGFAALTDAHFAARWGEVHALLGENGAGKSSLMNIAAGLYAPEAGQLLVDDNVVRFAGPRDAARHRIGMVHQHFKLVRPFTVAQNILLTAPPPAEFQSHGERLREIERDIRNKARSWASTSTLRSASMRSPSPSSSAWRSSRYCSQGRAS
jgi:ABC-type uncharacterized transport system ATPase subunit